MFGFWKWFLNVVLTQLFLWTSLAKGMKVFWRLDGIAWTSCTVVPSCPFHLVAGACHMGPLGIRIDAVVLQSPRHMLSSRPLDMRRQILGDFGALEELLDDNMSVKMFRVNLKVSPPPPRYTFRSDQFILQNVKTQKPSKHQQGEVEELWLNSMLIYKVILISGSNQIEERTWNWVFFSGSLQLLSQQIGAGSGNQVDYVKIYWEWWRLRYLFCRLVIWRMRKWQKSDFYWKLKCRF